MFERNIRSIKKNLRKEVRRGGFRLDSGKPMQQVAVNMISNIKKEEIILKIN